MDYEFPREFDLIIVGTGVIESILSAAASRIGKRVLHIDENEFYGDQWASFGLEGFTKLNSGVSKKDNTPSTPVVNLIPFGNNLFNIKDIECKFHVLACKENVTNVKETALNETEAKEIPLDEKDIVEGKPLKENDEAWNDKLLLKASRKFNIDLYPKIQYARGDFVDLLISSNVARYSEFRSVSRILTWFINDLESLPCSRSDIFANNRVSVLEKRILMKLLTSLNDEENTQNYEGKSFKEFLKEKKLSPNLIHYVLYGISMSSDDISYKDAIQKSKRFLNSLGRFGKTPFLFSLYGSGEIPQAFCRLSAVFGGMFALGQPIQGFTLNDGKFKSVMVRNQTIEAEHLIMGIKYLPKQYIKSKKQEYISRCVLITDKSVLDTGREDLTLISYPPENGKPYTILIELGHLTGTCPNNVYLTHLIAKQHTCPEEDFKHIIDNLFINSSNQILEKNKSRPLILWSTYFSLPDTSYLELHEDLPNNIFICPGPDMDLDYDFSIAKAKQLFNKIYPGVEFLPRAPDPEEIIIGGDEDDENAEKTKEMENIDKKEKLKDQENSAEEENEETAKD